MANVRIGLSGGGVTPDQTVGAYTPTSYQKTPATYFPNTCAIQLTPEFLNALHSELECVVDKAGLSWDDKSLCNLYSAIGIIAQNVYNAGSAAAAGSSASGVSVNLVKNSVTTRQTVVSAPTNSDGSPNIIPSGLASLNILTNSISASSPLVITAPNPNGTGDYVTNITSNLNFGNVPANAISYLYVNASTGAAGFTNLPPVYQYGGTPSPNAGQFTFDIAAMKGYMGNGTTANPLPLVFVGQVTTNSNSVTSAVNYALNGYYEGQWASGAPAQIQPVSTNLGFTPNIVELLAKNLVAEAGYSPGDVVVGPWSVADGQLLNTMSMWANANQVGFNAWNGIYGVQKSTAVGQYGFNLSDGKWAWKVVASRGW